MHDRTNDSTLGAHVERANLQKREFQFGKLALLT